MHPGLVERLQRLGEVVPDPAHSWTNRTVEGLEPRKR